MTDVYPDKEPKEKDEVVVVLSMVMYDKDLYEGIKVNKITPSKIIDDWGTTIGEVHPLVFVGQKDDIQFKLDTHIQNEWIKHDAMKRRGKNGRN